MLLTLLFLAVLLLTYSNGANDNFKGGWPPFGALTDTQPISIDAIDEMQVVLSPFNVTLGNFTGANINAVTKSGTNRLAGTVYSFARNQVITGRSVDAERKPIENYYDIQSGASLGGAIIKNRFFYFANYENPRREEPVLSAPGEWGAIVPLAVAQQISDKLKSAYNLRPRHVWRRQHSAQQRQVSAAPRL